MHAETEPVWCRQRKHPLHSALVSSKEKSRIVTLWVDDRQADGGQQRVLEPAPHKIHHCDGRRREMCQLEGLPQLAQHYLSGRQMVDCWNVNPARTAPKGHGCYRLLWRRLHRHLVSPKHTEHMHPSASPIRVAPCSRMQMATSQANFECFASGRRLSCCVRRIWSRL